MPEKLLIVDDEADVRVALARVLRGPYVVLEAPDGEKALSLIAREKPRLVLLDVSMPGMGGLEVLERALAMNPSLLVLMLTSREDADLAARALTLGAAEFVTKPFDASFIRKEVLRLLKPQGRPQEEPPWRHAS
ncbi:MAG: response regulator [Elusimicrobiota bacterium]